MEQKACKGDDRQILPFVLPIGIGKTNWIETHFKGLLSKADTNDGGDHETEAL